MCDKLVDKILFTNSYILDILTGEGILNKRSDILRIKKPDEEIYDETDTKQVSTMIESLVNKKMNHVNSQINSLISTVRNHEGEISALKENVNKIANDITTVKKDINGLHENVITVKTKMDTNHLEIKDLLTLITNRFNNNSD